VGGLPFQKGCCGANNPTHKKINVTNQQTTPRMNTRLTDLSIRTWKIIYGIYARVMVYSMFDQPYHERVSLSCVNMCMSQKGLQYKCVNHSKLMTILRQNTIQFKAYLRKKFLSECYQCANDK